MHQREGFLAGNHPATMASTPGPAPPNMVFSLSVTDMALRVRLGLLNEVFAQIRRTGQSERKAIYRIEMRQRF